MRFQLLKNNIKNIDRVLYSHFHADQTHGINDLRIFFIKNKKKIPIYCDKQTKNYLLKNFNYCFKKTTSYQAILRINPIKKINQFIKTIKVKVQPQTQSDSVRVASKKKDDLQTVMQAIKGEDFDFDVQFTNYR